jgi:chromosome segregation ATPase
MPNWFNKMKDSLTGQSNTPAAGPTPAGALPVQRSVSEPASAAALAATQQSVARLESQLAGLRQSLESLQISQLDLSQQIDRLRTQVLVNPASGTKPTDDELTPLKQQLEAHRLQHDSLMASLQEFSGVHQSHKRDLDAVAQNLGTVSQKLGDVERVVGHLGNTEDLREQLQSTAKLKADTEVRIGDLTTTIKRLQGQVSTVIQSSEIAREAFLVRDNARIDETKRERTTIYALLGVAILVGLAAFLMAMKAMQPTH